MIKKSAYISPLTEIVKLNLMIPIQQEGIPVDGSQENEHAWAREHGSFFDDEEFDDGFLNGGPNMFTDWEDKDRL
jgi:hypothetical protein